MPIISSAEASQLGAIGTTRQVVNRRTGIHYSSFQQGPIIVKGDITRHPKPLPLGYLLHYPIDILIHIFWLASRDDPTTLQSLSRVSSLLREVCKPFMPPKLTLSRSRHVLQLMGPSSEGAEAIAEHYRQLVNLPDAQHIQALRDEYPSKRVVRAERFLCGRPYSGPQPQLGREMCDRETQVDLGDQAMSSWASSFLPQSRIIRRPQPQYLLGYPTDVLTRIFTLACADDPAIGRSLCLVSKDFHVAVKPVMLHWVRLKRLRHVLGLARLISVDAVVKWRIHRLTIDNYGLKKALFLDERDWDLISRAAYLDKSESADESEEDPYESEDSCSYESGEEMDLEEDVAFLASPEGQLCGNLSYDADGELIAGARWPWDVGLEEARALVNNITSDILHALAPTLRHLELIPRDPQLSVRLPTFQELSVLTIRATLLPCLKDHPHVLFPALKTLRILGRRGVDHIDLDNLIHHAPSITLLRVAFGRDLLRDIVERLAIVPHPFSPLPSQKRRFECVEMIHVGYDDTFVPRRIPSTGVFGAHEKGSGILSKVALYCPYDASEESG